MSSGFTTYMGYVAVSFVIRSIIQAKRGGGQIATVAKFSELQKIKNN